MSDDKLTWNGAFTMAVGGMVGGGIFSVLGVVISLAGGWAWAAFLLAGAVALLASLSYVALTTTWKQGGGLYGFLRRLGHPTAAGNAAWLLVAGYVLTMAVYAFTFGHYLAHVLGVGQGVWPRLFGVAAVTALVVLNVRGVGDSQRVEEVTVWGKLAVLLGLAAVGLFRFDPSNLASGQSDIGLVGVLVGAASIFMAYEGFQLLAYDYEDIEEPQRVLPLVVPTAVGVVTALYILVALGAASLVGADTLVDQKEVALAAAGEAAAGRIGLIAVTVAAVFSTGSAINATLFATARLAQSVAKDGQYPRWIAHRNDQGVPSRAVIVLGVPAGVLAAIGGLGTLVEAASLIFLGAFAAVATIAALTGVGRRIPAALGAAGAAGAAVALAVRLALTEPWALAVLAAGAGAAMLGRWWVAGNS